VKQSKSDNTAQKSTSETQVNNTGEPMKGIGSNNMLIAIGLVLFIGGLWLTFGTNYLFILMAFVGLVLLARGMV